jgi:hypothetical protein
MTSLGIKPMTFCLVAQSFPTCGTRTPEGYVKIILVMVENTKRKGVKIKTQKQSYEVLVYKDLCESCH